MLPKLIFTWSRNYFAKTILRLCALCLILFSSQIIYGQDAAATPAPTPTPPITTDVTQLEFDKPIERVMSGRPRHTYKITLSPNQYIKITIEQHDIDIGTRLYGPDNKQICDYDGELRPNKPEIIEFVPKVEGVYRFDIINKFPLAPAGKYGIRFVEKHSASDHEIAQQEARGLRGESLRLFNTGNYEASKQAIVKALEIEKRELGLGDIVIVSDLSLLNRVYNALGEYEEAVKIGDQIMAIREHHPEPNRPTFGSAMNEIANTYGWLEDYPKSIEYYRRALESFKIEIGESSPAVAAIFINLGEDYKLLGDEQTALDLYRQALAIQEKSARPEDYNTAVLLNNIGVIYTEQKDYAKAETTLLKALKVVETYYQPGNPRTIETLTALADCYTGMRNYNKAEELFKRALAIREKSAGPDNPLVATAAFNLGTLYGLKNDLDRAEPLFRRALEIREKSFGSDNPLVGNVLTELALLAAEKGNPTESLKLQQRANEINESSISLNLTIGSERQKLAYLNSLFDRTNQSIFLQTKFAPGDKLAAELAATTILRQKGRILDAGASNLSELRRRADPQNQQLLDKFNKITRQTAELTLGGPENLPLAEHLSKIKALTDEREKIEDEISRRAAGFFLNSKPVTLSQIQTALPLDAALVEFAVYTPASSYAEMESASTEKHYIVYVLRGGQASGEIKWKELGDASAIDRLIEQWRGALRDPKRKDAAMLGRALDEKIMQPVRALTNRDGNPAKHLLISPDGELNLIPFEALVDERQNYLIKDYSFTYLTSGRDLLRMNAPRDSQSSPLVMSAPQFGEMIAEKAPGPTTVSKTGKISNFKRSSNRSARRRSTTTGRNLSDTYFAPLSGTLSEAREIQALFPNARLLSGAQATETALKETKSPQILHIATHGFFLEDKNNSSGGSQSKPVPPARDAQLIAQTENPLLRSGLALANANARRAAPAGGNSRGDDDGILTALEASGLNLRGTKLVVLSACDTGLGEVKNGEGVYGLRRAFVLAGAESLVMSLWSVSDYATRELMTNYYKNLKNGLGRGEALRQVQLQMLKEKGHEHPFYWAGFIQSGEWANLAGKR